MTNLIVELSKFAFIILIALYSLLSFSAFKKRGALCLETSESSDVFYTFAGLCGDVPAERGD